MKRRHRAVQQPMAQINVTSMLDITFVLLITFMIVAPALRYGIDLELPEVREAPVVENASKPVTVAVKPGVIGPEIYVNGEVTDAAQVVSAVKLASGGELARQAVTLEGDKAIDWETMARILADLRGGGIENIGIMTELEG